MTQFRKNGCQVSLEQWDTKNSPKPNDPSTRCKLWTGSDVKSWWWRWYPAPWPVAPAKEAILELNIEMPRLGRPWFFLPGVEGLLSRCFLAALKSLKGNFAVCLSHHEVIKKKSPTFPHDLNTPKKSYSQFARVFYSRFQVLEIRNLRIYVGRFFPILITSL